MAAFLAGAGPVGKCNPVQEKTWRGVIHGMDGQLQAGPSRSCVWNAPNLTFNSPAAKCADSLSQPQSPTANSGNQRGGKWMLVSLLVLLLLGKDSYATGTMETVQLRRRGKDGAG